MLTILFDEAEERGIEKGRREGRRIGKKEGERIGKKKGERIGEIIGTIWIYDSEIHLPPTEIVKKIMVRFSLKKEEAERYVEQTLKQRKAAARRRGTLKNGEGNEKKQS